MSLSVWVLLNFLEAKGLCLFLTKYFVKPLNKSCQQSKAKKKEKKKGSLGHQFVFLRPKTRPHKYAPTDSVLFSVKDKAKKLTTTEVKPWIMSNCGGSALAFTYVPSFHMTWLDLNSRYVTQARHVTLRLVTTS